MRERKQLGKGEKQKKKRLNRRTERKRNREEYDGGEIK